ncbi:MAG: HDOD domain-containing protein, partial [Myxococcota bacterium]|nr:HDOD domain-containing protein [Myxococcota bacterium]
SPQVTVNDLTRILERDPALSMRLLRMANDELISPVNPCRSIHEAILRVGIRPVRHLLMKATSERLLVIPDNPELTERLQGRAPAVARCSRRIARRIGADVNVAFTAGLLHDIGWAITFDLLRNHPECFPDWVYEERTKTWPAIAEYAHQVLGGALARAWELPTPVVAAIAFHHHPIEAGEPEAEMAYIVSVANTLCDHLDLYPDPKDSAKDDWSSALAIGVDPERLQQESVGLGRSLRQDLDGMAIGVWRPGLGQKHAGRGLGALDDGLEDLR